MRVALRRCPCLGELLLHKPAQVGGPVLPLAAGRVLERLPRAVQLPHHFLGSAPGDVADVIDVHLAREVLRHLQAILDGVHARGRNPWEERALGEELALGVSLLAPVLAVDLDQRGLLVLQRQGQREIHVVIEELAAPLVQRTMLLDVGIVFLVERRPARLQVRLGGVGAELLSDDVLRRISHADVGFSLRLLLGVRAPVRHLQAARGVHEHHAAVLVQGQSAQLGRLVRQHLGRGRACWYGVGAKDILRQLADGFLQLPVQVRAGRGDERLLVRPIHGAFLGHPPEHHIRVLGVILVQLNRLALVGLRRHRAREVLALERRPVPLAEEQDVRRDLGARVLLEGRVRQPYRPTKSALPAKYSRAALLRPPSIVLSLVMAATMPPGFTTSSERAKK